MWTHAMREAPPAAARTQTSTRGRRVDICRTGRRSRPPTSAAGPATGGRKSPSMSTNRRRTTPPQHDQRTARAVQPERAKARDPVWRNGPTAGRGRRGPAQVPGEPGEPIGGAEPDEQQTDRRVGAGLGHLNQVLLAGQSMPVPQQHHDLHVAQRRKRGRLPGRGHRRRRPELLDDPELTFEHQISSGPAQASAEDVVVDRTFDDAVGHAIDALPEQFRTVCGAARIAKAWERAWVSTPMTNW